jgi:hypothetical protein
MRMIHIKEEADLEHGPTSTRIYSKASLKRTRNELLGDSLTRDCGMIHAYMGSHSCISNEEFF